MKEEDINFECPHCNSTILVTHKICPVCEKLRELNE